MFVIVIIIKKEEKRREKLYLVLLFKTLNHRLSLNDVIKILCERRERSIIFPSSLENPFSFSRDVSFPFQLTSRNGRAPPF